MSFILPSIAPARPRPAPPQPPADSWRTQPAAGFPHLSGTRSLPSLASLEQGEQGRVAPPVRFVKAGTRFAPQTPPPPPGLIHRGPSDRFGTCRCGVRRRALPKPDSGKDVNSGKKTELPPPRIAMEPERRVIVCLAAAIYRAFQMVTGESELPYFTPSLALGGGRRAALPMATASAHAGGKDGRVKGSAADGCEGHPLITPPPSFHCFS
ncbi:hypothetical protein SKAU_G00242670 [Synaphobranchus kaupii]|uniref:Uncharacterized protein n=1 Tax=Synaphobranchus kaupii TaxID=118154 RepID=A0A9Q1F8A7_SYNKA|nr:hypothetical protein SKAU_G00242670 [Synaphobranchus kaupii]